MGALNGRMEQVRKLKIGLGVQAILDEAHLIFGNPMLLFRTDYTCLAHTKTAADDPAWNEMLATGTFSDETLQRAESEGFLEDIANASKVAVLTGGQLHYDKMIGKVFNRDNAYVANLEITAADRPFDEHDAIVLESVCKLMSKEISRDDFYQTYELHCQEAALQRLLDGAFEQKRDFAHLGNIYDSLESNLYIAVIDVSQCSAEQPGAASTRDLLRQELPACKYAVYSDYVIAIMGTDDETLRMNATLDGLAELLERYNLYAGLSARFENLFELRQHCAQALDALRYTLDARSERRLFPCCAGSMEKMKQIDALESGIGIQAFLNQGAEMFGNPLLFHDMELNLLAYTEGMEISDPIWQELIADGTSSSETIALFRTEGIIDTMDAAKGGALLTSKKIKYDRISWRIYNSDNIRIGCTSIVNTFRPFSADELVLFGIFSNKFSKEVGKIEFYKNYGQLYSETVINRLISGKMDDYTFYTEDIGSLYDNLKEHLFLIVVNAAQCRSENINLNGIRNMFPCQDTVRRYAIYADHILIIVSSDRTSLRANAGFQALCRMFALHNIVAGISNRFENIYELQTHYLEAVRALNAGLKQDAPRRQWVFEADDLT